METSKLLSCCFYLKISLIFCIQKYLKAWATFCYFFQTLRLLFATFLKVIKQCEACVWLRNKLGWKNFCNRSFLRISTYGLFHIRFTIKILINLKIFFLVVERKKNDTYFFFFNMICKFFKLLIFLFSKCKKCFFQYCS